LKNSQKEINELLRPLVGGLETPDRPNGPRESIDVVSRSLKNSLIDLQKMHSQQNAILSHFKQITGDFDSYTKTVKQKSVSCQTDFLEFQPNINILESVKSPKSDIGYTKCNHSNSTFSIIAKEYKFKLYHIVNNPRVSVEITSKNKILEPILVQKTNGDLVKLFLTYRIHISQCINEKDYFLKSTRNSITLKLRQQEISR